MFHDQIWFNSIRELLRVGDRKGSGMSDPVLDHLIRDGLIEKNEDHVSVAFQQAMRYSAVLAGRITGHNYRLEQNVRTSPLDWLQTIRRD